MTRIRALVPLAALLCSTCVDESETYAAQAGTYIDYHWYSEYVLCGGTVDYLDAFVAQTANTLGRDPSELERFEYIWASDLDFEREVTSLPARTQGIAGRRVTRSLDPALLHEIVHLVDPSRGMPFLTEGLAEAISRPYGPPGAPSDPRLWLDVYPVIYPAADAFVSFLLDRFGLEKLAEFRSVVPRGAGADDFAAAFEQVYEQDLDDAVADLLNEIACPENSAPITRPYNCTAPLLPMTGDASWAHARSLACEDSDVVGGFGVYTRVGASTSLTLEVPEDGLYRLAVFADTPNMKGVLTPCDVCSWRSDSVSAYPSRPDKKNLTAGTYAFTYIVDQPESTLVAMTLERVTP